MVVLESETESDTASYPLPGYSEDETSPTILV
jgi:hypothetical protein